MCNCITFRVFLGRKKALKPNSLNILQCVFNLLRLEIAAQHYGRRTLGLDACNHRVEILLNIVA